MSSRRIAGWQFGFAGLVVCCLLLITARLSQADDQDDKAQPTDVAGAAEKDAQGTEDPHADTPEAMLKRLEELKVERPVGENRKELSDSMRDVQRKVAKMADKILAANPDEETRKTAIKEKMVALAKLYQMGDKKALDRLFETSRKLVDDPDKDIAGTARSIVFQVRLQRLMDGDVAQAAALAAEAKKAVKANPDSLTAFFDIALKVGHALETVEEARDLAVSYYRDLIPLIEKSKNEQIAEYAETFTGVLRRLSLPGKPIEFRGVLVGGEKFDPKTLEGKIVLVDFWATWCGPCLEELPNVRLNYEKYHDQGFEVVGVTLDDDLELVANFVEEHKIPWPSLTGEGETKRGFHQPMAEYYGVYAIPQVILLDRSGKVIALNARGEKLGELLEKLMGSPAQKKAKK